MKSIVKNTPDQTQAGKQKVLQRVIKDSKRDPQSIATGPYMHDTQYLQYLVCTKGVLHLLPQN